MTPIKDMKRVFGKNAEIKEGMCFMFIKHENAPSTLKVFDGKGESFYFRRGKQGTDDQIILPRYVQTELDFEEILMIIASFHGLEYRKAEEFPCLTYRLVKPIWV
jgi:hypothetical protein